jgi:hypothetical protein
VIRKVILGNDGALIKKYTRDGYSVIWSAIQRLIRADWDRGIETTYVAVDSAADMERLGRLAITPLSSEKDYKDAVDCIYNDQNPEYLVLLGAPDIIPHQTLQNIASSAGHSAGDGDLVVASDLPYACNAAYNTDMLRFTLPTRVVGRIPDILHDRAPGYLVSVLDAARKARPSRREDYAAFFGLTSAECQDATSRALCAIVGSDMGRQVPRQPSSGGDWQPSPRDFANLAHLINCHGRRCEESYYADGPSSQFRVMVSDWVGGNVTPRTVVAAECCFGAELFGIDQNADGLPSIANMYLSAGAIGYFGSTDFSFGAKDAEGDTNLCADLICQYFWQSVLGGASLGRATLEARLRFVEDNNLSVPINTKTLAQFLLLGDPSVQPVESSDRIESAARRRLDLYRRGLALSDVPVAVPDPTWIAPPEAARELERIAADRHADPVWRAYRVERGYRSDALLPADLLARAPDIEACYLTYRVEEVSRAPQEKRVTAIVAGQAVGRIVEVSSYDGKGFRRDPRARV